MSDNTKQKSNVDHAALKIGMWYVISEILIRGVSFLATPIYTRILPQAVFGDVKIYDSWIYLLTPILSLGIYNSIERAKFDFHEKYDSYVSSVITMVLLFDLIIGVFVWPFRHAISAALECPEELMLLMIVYIAFYTATLCVQKRERQMLQYRKSILISFLTVILTVGVSVIAVMRLGQGASEQTILDTRVFGFYGPAVLLGLAIALIAFARGKSFINFSYWKYGLKFSLPFIFYSISMQVLNQSDKIMVKKFCGSDLAGIYAVATTVVYIMDVLNNAIQSAWMPWMFEKMNVNEQDQIDKVWKKMLVGMGALTWMIVMAGPELIAFLGGKKYAAAVWLLGPMVTGSFFHFISVGYTNTEKFYKRTGCAAFASLLSMCVNLVLNYFFILKFGYTAAAYTTAASYLVAVLLHCIFMKYVIRKQVLVSGYTCRMILIVLALNLCTMFLYRFSYLLRWGLIAAVLAATVYYYRKELVELKKQVFKH